MIKLLILAILLLPLAGMACTCGGSYGPVTIKDYNSAKLILSGKAIKVTVDRTETTDMQRKIDFKIDEVFKGRVSSGTVSIYTSLGDASCGLFVQEGQEWVIWAYLQGGVITTDLCTRSAQKKQVIESDYTSLKYFKSNPLTLIWKNSAGVVIAAGELKDNLPEGTWKYFYNNGFMETEGNYSNGLYDGRWVKYLDPEGIVERWRYDKKIPPDSNPDLQLLQYKVRAIENYRQGVREGEFVDYSYTSIDKPSRITNYKDGRTDGVEIHYYDNGMIHYVQNYSEGNLEGSERFYHRNGRLKQEGQFVKSKPTGEFSVYDENGVLIKRTFNARPR